MAGEPPDKKTVFGTPPPQVQPPRVTPYPADVMRGSVAVPAVSPSQVMPAGTAAPVQVSDSQPYAVQSYPPYPQQELSANVPAAGAPAYVAPVDPLVGQVLAGRYHIAKKLGEGGMGAVYLATHIVLEKQVALKVLHGEYARKPDLVERFMQEAKSASRIRHENVIDISDFGSTGDGLVFFAMELLRGHDLHEEIARARLAGKRLPWARSRPIFLQICAALSAAHSHGIVHRDLKPENIYLVDFLGHSDFVKLLDFGIAKMTEVSEGDRKLTKTGMLFGTPEYMSPEQARGENVDHRVDVYAMGCILFQLISGRVPFEAENFMGILSLHLMEPPPPIGAPILDEIGAPRALEAIVMKALAKNRDERFQTIDDMANAIRALHGEAQVEVQHPNVPLAAGRVKTQWTGNLHVPTEDERVLRPASGGSKLPWVIAAVLIAGGAGAAAFLLTRKDKAAGASTPQPGLVIDAAPGTPPPEVLPDTPLPARVTISLDSEPKGADIFDVASGTSMGPAPMEFELAGSHEPRRYRLTKDGFVGKVIELVPDENVQYTATLKPGKGSAAVAAEPEVEIIQEKRRKSSGKTGTGTGTGSGSGTGTGPVTDPDQTDRIPDRTPDKVPDKTPDKVPDKTPDKVPDRTPDKTPDKVPDKTPDKVPDPDDEEPKIKDPFAGMGGGT